MPQKKVNKDSTSPVLNKEMELDIKAELIELRKLKRDIEERSKLINTTDSVSSPLKNKIIKIAPIEKKGNDSIKDPSEATMLTRSSRSIVTPIDQRGVIIQPLEDWERAYFEKVLKIDLNHLEKDPYKNFWASKQATLFFRKTTRNINSATLFLDLSKPYDYILYKIALISPRIANSWSERYQRGEYSFVIIDDNDRREEEIAYNSIEDYVLEKILANKHSKKYLFDILRLYGSNKLTKAITVKTPVEVLYNEIKKLARNKKDVRGLYGVMKMDKKDFDFTVFVEDAISYGFIEIRGNEYTLKGGQTIAYSKEEAITYFKNPENQSIKLQIEGQIRAKLKI